MNYYHYYKYKHKYKAINNYLMGMDLNDWSSSLNEFLYNELPIEVLKSIFSIVKMDLN